MSWSDREGIEVDASLLLESGVLFELCLTQNIKLYLTQPDSDLTPQTQTCPNLTTQSDFSDFRIFF